jgi:hypothetical protein
MRKFRVATVPGVEVLAGLDEVDLAHQRDPPAGLGRLLGVRLLDEQRRS